jgi:hypothetical protein
MILFYSIDQCMMHMVRLLLLKDVRRLNYVIKTRQNETFENFPQITIAAQCQ